MALFADPLKDPLRSVHHTGRRDALPKVGDEGTRGVAARVIRAVATRFGGGAAQAAEVARCEGGHGAGRRLVNEKVDRGLAVVDGVAVVTAVMSDEAGAIAMVEASHGRNASPAGAKHAPLEGLLRVAKGIFAAVESGSGRAVGVDLATKQE